jgi:transcription antitermination factor NusG
MIQQPQATNAPIIYSEKDFLKWYVAYTFPKAERKVQSRLDKMGIVSYLPMHEVVRDWSDRKKKLVVPLFPNYIFICTSSIKRHEVFDVKEVIRYVSFGGRPATVSDAIINSLRCILREGVEIDIERLIKTGEPVSITKGPFAGTEGIVVKRNGKTRLVVQIEALQRSISINISVSDAAPLQYTDDRDYGRHTERSTV